MNKHPINNNFYNIVRERDKWTCQECLVHFDNNFRNGCQNGQKECGSNEYVQAHHIEHYNGNNNNPENGITLCIYCHAEKHPEVPLLLFLSQVIKTKKEGNIPAGKLAKELSVHPRTIVRHARRLNIIQPMQQWVFTQDEVKSIRDSFIKPNKISYLKKPKTFMMDSQLHYKMKLLSSFYARPLSDEIEQAILEHLEKNKETIVRLEGGNYFGNEKLFGGNV